MGPWKWCLPRVAWSSPPAACVTAGGARARSLAFPRGPLITPPPARPAPPPALLLAPCRSLQPKYRSPLSVGFLIGVSLMMIFLLLELGVISGANMARFGGSDTSSSTQAVTAFASLLLIAETTFTVFVILYRDTLLPPQPMTSSDHSEVPPSLPGGAFSGTAAGSTGGYAGGPSIGPYSGSDTYGDKSVAGGYDTTEHVSITPTIGGSAAGGSGQGVL